MLFNEVLPISLKRIIRENPQNVILNRLNVNKTPITKRSILMVSTDEKRIRKGKKDKT